MFSSWKIPLLKYCGCVWLSALQLLPSLSSIHGCESQSWCEVPNSDSNRDEALHLLSSQQRRRGKLFPLLLASASSWGTCSGCSSHQLTSSWPCQLWQGPGASTALVIQKPFPWGMSRDIQTLVPGWHLAGRTLWNIVYALKPGFVPVGSQCWVSWGNKHLLAEVGTDSHTVTLSAQELSLPAKCHILNPDIKVTELGYATNQPQLPLLQVRTLA